MKDTTKWHAILWLLIVGSLSFSAPSDAQCSGTGAVSPVTSTDETMAIPGSRQLVNGSGTTIDTTTPGQIKVSVTAQLAPLPLQITNYSAGGTYTPAANTFTNVTSASQINLLATADSGNPVGSQFGLTIGGSLGGTALNAASGDSFVFNGSKTGTSIILNNGDEINLTNLGSGTWLVTSYLPQGGSVGSAWSILQGGTGSATASGARTNLGAAASGSNSDITSLTGLTTALSVAQGGTGSSVAGAAVFDARLTAVTGTPVPTSDQSNVTTVYLTAYKGTAIGLYGGSAWVVDQLSSDASLSLAGLASGNCYDVFAYDSSGSVTLAGVAWTNTTTRATNLALQDGIWVSASDHTRRYVGTFYTSAAGTTQDKSAERFIWNYYNRVDHPMFAQVPTTTWTYGSATIRPSDNNTTDGQGRVSFVIGFVEDSFQSNAIFTGTNSTVAYENAISLNSTNSITAPGGGISVGGSSATSATPFAYASYPALGLNYLQMVEYTGSTTTATFNGRNGTRNSWMHAELKM